MKPETRNCFLKVLPHITRTSLCFVVVLVHIGNLIGLVSVTWSMKESEESVGSIKEEIERVRALPYTTDPLIATELAGLYLDLGNEIDQDPDQRIAEYKEGARVAQNALDLKEDLADAHFYYAANLGSAAYLQGILASLVNLQDLTDHVTRTLELQEKHAPAHHMRGMMLEELPWFLGGDSEKALQHLQRAVEIDNYYMHARLHLGEAYLDRDRINEAIQELQFVVLNEPRESKRKWAKQYRPEAERLLNEINTEILHASP
ncbi:MAG: tetratricopeptide repeat protein [Nitrospirota bacterium]|nr:MAG: tetratricopeptide repeat protein [Nitrospirota bacterium]